MCKVRVASPLRPHLGGQKEVELQGETAEAVLQNLIACYPGLQNYLYDERGRLRPFVNIFVNDEDVRHLQGENTRVGESDVLKVFPAIAGGCRPRSLLRSPRAGNYPNGACDGKSDRI